MKIIDKDSEDIIYDYLWRSNYSDVVQEYKKSVYRIFGINIKKHNDVYIFTQRYPLYYSEVEKKLAQIIIMTQCKLYKKPWFPSLVYLEKLL